MSKGVVLTILVLLVALAYLCWRCCKVGAEEDERCGWK